MRRFKKDLCTLPYVVSTTQINHRWCKLSVDSAKSILFSNVCMLSANFAYFASRYRRFQT